MFIIIKITLRDDAEDPILPYSCDCKSKNIQLGARFSLEGNQTILYWVAIPHLSGVRIKKRGRKTFRPSPHTSTI